MEYREPGKKVVSANVIVIESGMSDTRSCLPDSD